MFQLHWRRGNQQRRTIGGLADTLAGYRTHLRAIWTRAPPLPPLAAALIPPRPHPPRAAGPRSPPRRARACGAAWHWRSLQSGAASSPQTLPGPWLCVPSPPVPKQNHESSQERSGGYSRHVRGVHISCFDIMGLRFRNWEVVYLSAAPCFADCVGTSPAVECAKCLDIFQRLMPPDRWEDCCKLNGEIRSNLGVIPAHDLLSLEICVKVRTHTRVSDARRSWSGETYLASNTVP